MNQETLIERYREAQDRYISLFNEFEGTQPTPFDAATLEMRRLIARWFFTRVLYSVLPALDTQKTIQKLERTLFQCVERRNTLFR